jgi:hypothetical protein
MNGAGHGTTVLGPSERYWHFATMALPVNVQWERRLCMFPTFFDKDGVMYCDNSFGDYPHFAPAVAGKAGEFTGWMLLSYNKPVEVSSSLENFLPGNIVDENAKTFWVAKNNDNKQWIQIDLVKPGKVYAIQVNYNDHQSNMYGRIPNLHHRYLIEGSMDGQNWRTLVDRKDNYKDVPNDYVELASPETVRYIRYKNIYVPTPNLSISDLRVFGLGQGKAPAIVKNLKVNRYKDRRDAMITWDQQPNCQGYNVLWGIAPDKLYSSWMVYEKNSLLLKSLTIDQQYYFAIEAFNENGISERTKVVKVE